MPSLSAIVCVVGLSLTAAGRTPQSSLPIINDDVTRARAEASRLRVPIFVEAWAPW